MRLFLALLALAWLVGCGNKGPLYLPKPATGAQKPGPLVTPAPPPERPLPAESAPSPK